MNRTPEPERHDGSRSSHGTRDTYDVLVVGAGPTGLLLAGDLAEAGHAVGLVERRADTISNLSRALVVHARTMEQFDARGLADELAERGHPIEKLRLFGHATLDPTRLHSRFPYVLVTPQYEVEQLLERRARKAGVTFLYGTRMRGLRQNGEGVEVDVLTGAEAEADADADARAGVLRARYLVGTDGVHSSVREAIGLPFPGRSALRSIVLADVRLAQAPDSPFAVNASRDAFAVIGTFGDGWHRVIGWSRDRQFPDSAPVDMEEVRAIARGAFGTDYGMHDARWMSRFHSDERQAPAYRVGRVFLAGDAAHVHSPAGGMGMNTGLQDAANLGWKLAAVLGGHAGDALLDTYEGERHPVGALVLRTSGAVLRLALAGSGPGRAVRSTVAGLINRVRPLADRGIRTVSGIGIDYPAPRGSHPLTGRRVPDLALAEGRLYELLRGGRFVLVTPERRHGPDGADTGAADTGAADGYGDRVLRTTLRAASPRNTGRTLLIRPDGHVAWAADHPEQGGLRQALATWAGTAA
ncbi:FAD-dependent monooxygenase [Streptomyces sp. NPDC054796]